MMKEPPTPLIPMVEAYTIAYPFDIEYIASVLFVRML